MDRLNFTGYNINQHLSDNFLFGSVQKGENADQFGDDSAFKLTNPIVRRLIIVFCSLKSPNTLLKVLKGGKAMF
jgi:hypothetical protein